MKRIMNIRTGISTLMLVLAVFIFASTAYSQQIFNSGERQPFNSTQNGLLNKAPGSGPGGGIPPPTEENKVGGATVKDVYWLLPLLAIGYGLYSRQRRLNVKNE